MCCTLEKELNFFVVTNCPGSRQKSDSIFTLCKIF